MPARSLGELFVEIGARTGKLKKGFGEATQKLQKFGRQAMKIGAAMTAAGTAVSLALGKITKDTIEYGVKLDKLRKTVDATAEELSGLGYAAEQEHASFETLGKGLTILSKYMHYAEQGMATYKREFDAMGISVTDSEGRLRSAHDVFLDMADWMHTSGAPETEKTAVAFTLLGRSGKELIPMLKTGREHIKALSTEAKDLGITMDDKTAAAMKALSDEITKAKKGLRGIALEIGSTLAPILGKLVSALQVAFKWFKELPAPLKRNLTIGAALGAALLTVGGAFTMIAGVIAVAMPAITGLIGPLGMLLAAAVALAAGLAAVHYGLKQIEETKLSERNKDIAAAAADTVVRLNKELRRKKKLLEELQQTENADTKEMQRLRDEIEAGEKAIHNITGSTERMIHEGREARGITSIFGLEIDKLKGKLQGVIPTYDDLNLKLDDYNKKMGKAKQKTQEKVQTLDWLQTDLDLLAAQYPMLAYQMGCYGEQVEKAKEKTREFAIDTQHILSGLGQGVVQFGQAWIQQWRGMHQESMATMNSIVSTFEQMITQMIVKLSALAALSAIFPGGSILGAPITALIGLAEGGLLGKAQRGAILVERPTVYKGVLTGEKAPEIISPIDKLLEAIQPRIVVHEAGPNTWVEVLMKADDAAHDRLWREKIYEAQKRDQER